jgi:linoleoyl-CoA desaturase
VGANRRAERYDFIDEVTPAAKRDAWRKALRKYVPYLTMEYVVFPLLAGPFFWKVMLGNWLAGTLRDVYSAATIYCGHVGDEVHDYPEGTRAGSRARWYLMQVRATNNFEVPYPVSLLCGALDRQIEHHLFPRFAPNRLREVAPEVRRVCEAHGVVYRTGSWPRTLGRALATIWRLRRPQPSEVHA